MRVAFFFLLCFAFVFKSNSQKLVSIDNISKEINLADKISYYLDTTNEISLNEIVTSARFTESQQKFLNFKVTKHTVWLKIRLHNNSNFKNSGYLCIDQLNINKVELFGLVDGRLKQIGETYGTDFKIADSKNAVSGFTFEVNINPNDTINYYIRVSSKGQLFIPIYYRNTESFNTIWLNRFLFFGFYVGIILALLFYNMFLAISIKDDRKTYVWYLFHTFFILLTQSSLQGYTNLFLWPENHFMANQSIYLFTCLVSISGIEYAKSFLQLKKTNKVLVKVFNFYHVIYCLIMLISISGNISLAYSIIQPVQLTIAIIMLSISLNLVLKGNRLATFYFVSWSALFVGIIVFILTDFQVLPYNLFTSQIMLYGSALQVILLSIAQADKYNLLKIEEQKAQLQAVKVSKLNEEITKEQNVRLEQKVKERTNELTESNKQLSETLTVLKDTQIQLIEKEKMSSLGQLTAGIAHEINNPINFVSGNIKPLKRDVLMVIDLVNQIEQIAKLDETVELKTKRINNLKQDLDFDYLNEEIEFLLKGIEEGANRTTEIVKGLKVFSRSDEFETKFADIHEGINSTLVLLNNQLNNKIKVDKIFKAENGVIEHFPGKMNQVFMNLLSNSIYAVNKKWNYEIGGVITIKTEIVSGKFVITFSDNGIGMTPDVVNKMFDPFFTTKEVGEGTGLGMSIVYKTIEMHKGKILVDSELGKGTTFTIEIPNQLAI